MPPAVPGTADRSSSPPSVGLVSAWMGEMPGVAVSALVALVLVAESGLVLGVVLPGASLAIGMGVLAGAGLVPLPVAALTLALATVLVAALRHRPASGHGDSLLRARGRARPPRPGGRR